MLGDDPEYEKEVIRKQHYKNINGSTWAQKKVDKSKGEMGKLVGQHKKSMRDLSQPMCTLIAEMPAKKDSLSVMSGIFQEAVYNAELGAAGHLRRDRRAQETGQSRVAG